MAIFWLFLLFFTAPLGLPLSISDRDINDYVVKMHSAFGRELCGGAQRINCTEEGAFCHVIATKCQSPEVSGQCRSPPYDCSTYPPDPVCGCDLVDYINPCTAYKSRTSVLSGGRCPMIDRQTSGDETSESGCTVTLDCPDSETHYCAKNVDGRGACEPRPTRAHCDRESGRSVRSLVCGLVASYDGKVDPELSYETFMSRCDAAHAGANGPFTSGHCAQHANRFPPPTTDSCISDTDCSDPGGQYCVAASGACAMDIVAGYGRCETVPWGECLFDGLATSIVCGCDSKLYASTCEAARVKMPLLRDLGLCTPVVGAMDFAERILIENMFDYNVYVQQLAGGHLPLPPPSWHGDVDYGPVLGECNITADCPDASTQFCFSVYNIPGTCHTRPTAARCARDDGRRRATTVCVAHPRPTNPTDITMGSYLSMCDAAADGAHGPLLREDFCFLEDSAAMPGENGCIDNGDCDGYTVLCALPATCAATVGSYGMCVEPPGECEEGGDRVCGCDGRWYPNECAARRNLTTVWGGSGHYCFEDE